MKANIYRWLIIVSVVFCLGSHKLYAQDGLPSSHNNDIKELNFPQELNLNEDKTLLDVESKPVVSGTAIKENQPAKAGTGKGKSTELSKLPSEKEEDALSSNFLYMIIQKFKIPDILD